MYPNQQPPQPQSNYSIDYLNQIAPQGPKKGFLSRKQMIVAAVLGILTIIVLILVVVVNVGGNSKPTQQLAARLIATESIVGDAQDKLKSTELRTLNSNLKIYLTNTNRDIVAPLAKDKVDVKSLDKKIVEAESGAAMTARLEDARLNAVYDRTYAREMAYQLETISALMRQIYESTSNKDLKSFLDGAYKNLLPTQKSFEDFNAANG